METKPLETAGQPAASPQPAGSSASDQTLDALLGLAAPARQGGQTFFGFRVGSLGFLVPVGIHCEVMEQTQVNPLPNTQPWFNGLINLRGNLVPVIDLRLVLDEDKADPKKRRLFTIGKGEYAVGLWIDGLPEVLGIEAEPLAQSPALPELLAGFVNSVYQHQGQPWLNLDYDRFFKALGNRIGLS